MLIYILLFDKIYYKIDWLVKKNISIVNNFSTYTYFFYIYNVCKCCTGIQQIWQWFLLVLIRHITTKLVSFLFPFFFRWVFIFFNLVFLLLCIMMFALLYIGYLFFKNCEFLIKNSSLKNNRLCMYSDSYG